MKHLSVIFAAIILLVQSQGKVAGGEAGAIASRQAVSFTAPAIKEGLDVCLSGRKLIIAPGVCWVNDNPVSVSKETIIDVPVCPMVAVHDEALQLYKDGLKGPGSKTILSQCRAGNRDFAAISGVLVPGSLRIKSGAGEGKSFYKPEVDYLFDNSWGAIAKAPAGAIKEGQTVFADYVYFTRRLDTLVLDEAGNFKLLPGAAARSAPLPAAQKGDCIALAHIFAEPANGNLSASDFLPIAASEIPVMPVKIRNRNRSALSRTRERLASGGSLNIVFWGDSITCGADASSSERGFAGLVLSRLTARYPTCTINASNAGVGGSTTTSRLPKIDREVLSKKPDLIVIEFVNDVRLPKPELERNYRMILAKAREIRAEVLFVNPGFPAPVLLGLPNFRAVARTPYYQFLRDLSASSGTGLADVAARFQHFSDEGLTPELLLVDKLIHPNDLGHRIYAEEIFKCFN